MIGYTTIGSNQYEKSLDFYDKVLAVAGGKRVTDFGGMVLFGFSKGAMFGVCQPNDKKAATRGNGSMIALNVGTKENVHAMYDAALKNGATDDGPAGPRSDTFYAAYFRDPDGNKICAFTMLKSE